jgi:RNA polymerase sigma factor (sigma-70 family)
LLRLRSDEQLVALFRAGHDEAFRVIHDRYRQRLFAYTRQMLPLRQDAEDALQDIFVRAYSGLRANRRELALRAWLYRVAHNRCIDELRRPSPPPPEVIELLRSPVHDPIAEADQRESLRRLIADVRRLPDQQRSALLMRELGGMAYADMAAALGVTVPAVKSLLVRARLALAQALEARDTACSEIREELIVSHDRGLRPNANARRHMRDCAGCREFRHDLRGVSRRFAAIVPTLGPLGVIANVLGIGGAGGGAAGGALAASGAAGTGSVVAGTMSAGATHMATLLAAAVVTAGGAVELQQTLPTSHHPTKARTVAVAHPRSAAGDSSHAAPVSQSAITTPVITDPVITSPTHSSATSATGTAAKGSSSTGSRSALSGTPAKPTQHKKAPLATGGISAGVGTGGATISAPGDTATAPTDASTSGTSGTTGTCTATGTGTPTTGTGTCTGTGSTSSAGGQTSGSTSSTQPGTSTTASSTQPASSGSGAGTNSSTGTGSTGTGSSTGTAAGEPPAPPQ